MQKKYQLPNISKAYGSIIKLSGNRSKPFIVRLTIGYNCNGFPVYEILGSFQDELDAILCKRDYNTKPYDIIISKKKYDSIIKFTSLPSKILLESSDINIDRSNYTFKQVYDEYSKLYFPTKEEISIERENHQKTKGKFSIDTMYVRKAAFKDAINLHNTPYHSLRTIDFEQLVNCSPSPKKAQRLKYLFLELDNYAEQKDIISKGYAKFIKKVDIEITSKTRGVFTNEEIQVIWNDKPNSFNDTLVRNILLILLYTGMRIEELLFLFTKDIHLEQNYIVGGLKTLSGKGRIIPIHHVIKPLFQKLYNPNNTFLFMEGNVRFPYSKYRILFLEYMKRLNMKHTTHETRHTVESELDRKNANIVARNSIIGHKNKGTGEDVYTHKSIQELQDCIELLSYEDEKLIYLVSSN